MTLHVHFVAGDRRSACINHSLAVIERRHGGGDLLIDMIPLCDLRGLGSAEVLFAFQTAARDVGTEHPEILRTYARDRLFPPCVLVE